MKAKAGDYLLTKEKQLFRIVDIHTDSTGTYYDIKSCRTENVKFCNGDLLGWTTQYIRGIPRNRFRHLGKVIPEDKITKTLKILYG
jgi:hypothetical protein